MNLRNYTAAKQATQQIGSNGRNAWEKGRLKLRLCELLGHRSIYPKLSHTLRFSENTDAPFFWANVFGWQVIKLHPNTDNSTPTRGHTKCVTTSHYSSAETLFPLFPLWLCAWRGCPEWWLCDTLMLISPILLSFSQWNWSVSYAVLSNPASLMSPKCWLNRAKIIIWSLITSGMNLFVFVFFLLILHNAQQSLLLPKRMHYWLISFL